MIRAALLALLLALPEGAAAFGFQAGRYGAGIKAGSLHPTATNGFDSAIRSGLAGGLHGFYFPLDWFALGLDAGMFQFGSGFVVRPSPLADLRNRAKTMAVIGTGRVNLISDRPWTIYLLGGGGLHWATLGGEVTGVNLLDGQEGSASEYRKYTGIAVTAAGGAEVFVVKNLSLSFEARFHEFRYKSDELTRLFWTGDSFEGMTYLVGINYWFRVD